MDADPTAAATKLQSVEDAHKDAAAAAQAELEARLKDVKDARASEIEYVKSGSPMQWAPVVISIANVLGFYAIVAAVFFYKPELTVNQAALLNILIGAAIGAYVASNNFWLGSSNTSKNKDDALIGMARQPQVIQGPGSHVSGGVSPAKRAGR